VVARNNKLTATSGPVEAGRAATILGNCLGDVNGVSAPVPHGVDGSSRSDEYPVGEYIPKSVEDVRLRIECVRLGVSSRCAEGSSGLGGWCGTEF